MAALLADIGARDKRLVLATAKPIESAHRVLTKAGLIEHFDFVSGSELDLLRQDKPGVSAYGIAGIGADVQWVNSPGSMLSTLSAVPMRFALSWSSPDRWGYGAVAVTPQIRPPRVTPPSMMNVCPVIQPASGEARNATKPAMSCGVPSRPRG